MYNSNMYLTPEILNEIEDKIEEITKEIQEKIYNNNSELRTIQVGDKLNRKTLYLSFPRDVYKDINNTEKIDLVSLGEDNRISYIYGTDSKKYIYIRYNGIDYLIYGIVTDTENPYLNFVRYELPDDYGKVTDITQDDELFDYIKIYENELIIPDYVKHEWSKNEVVSMQKIDHIENGIKNIGIYYYKPTGWQSEKEWLGTAKTDSSNNYGVNITSISYQDLNRWVNNLNLIDFDKLDEMCIWNGTVSNLSWNTYSDIEWENV